MVDTAKRLVDIGTDGSMVEKTEEATTMNCRAKNGRTCNAKNHLL